MTYLAVDDVPGGMANVRFALQLTALPSDGGLSLPDRLHLQRLLISRVLDHAPISPLSSIAIELRAVKTSESGTTKVRIGLIVCLENESRKRAVREARALAVHASEVAAQLLGAPGYCFEVMDSAAEFEALAHPFMAADYGEVRREDEYCPVHLEEARPDVAPFAAFTSLNPIVAALVAYSDDALVGITLGPAPLWAHGASAAVDNCGDGDDQVDEEETHHLTRARVGVQIPEAVVETCSGRLEMLRLKGYLVRVHIAASSEISPALVAAVGGEAVGPSVQSSPAEFIRSDWVWTRPRSTARRRGQPVEADTAAQNLRYLQFSPWGSVAASDLLTLAASNLEAGRVFALPDPDPLLTALVPTTPIAPLPAHPAVPARGTVLGTNRLAHQPRAVALSADDRRRHLWILGQTGTGKSTLLESLALQDIQAGAPVILMEPHGDLIEQLLGRIPYDRIDDVIFFDPADRAFPLGVNLLEASSEDDWPFLINAFIGLLYRLYDPHRSGVMGPRFEHAARNAMMTVMSAGGTLIEVVRVLTDESFARSILPLVRDPLVRSYWEHEVARTSDFHKSETLGYFVSKFARFVSDGTLRNIVGQTSSSFDFRRAIDDRKIILINLAKGRLGAENSTFLGMVMLPKILLAALSRVDQPESERHDASLFIDEFQSFSSDALATMLAEARKYRVNLTLANQHVGQIDDGMREALIGNAGSVVAFRTGWQDAALVERAFMPSDLRAWDIAALPNFHAYARLLANGQPRQPFLLETARAASEYDATVAELVRESSRATYGRQRSAVEARIRDRMSAT